ncbi:MAG: glycosyltransferase [Alteraurantiacibacter sp.]
MPSVDLLLATYNSEKFLVPLLESLIAQSQSDFRLLVSDDCSSDATPAILDEFRPRFAEMEVVRRDLPSGSAKANFASLLETSDADYALFVDADDVWDADKVAVTVGRLAACEARFGSDTPVYVFTDARIVDGAGALTHDSFWRYKRMDPARGFTPACALVCPPMLGCLSGINRALKMAASPLPLDDITGHDWWLLLVAAFCGRAEAIDTVTASYRIHGDNASNQRPVDIASYAASPDRRERVRRGIELRRRQAEALLAHCGNAMPNDKRTMLERFAAIDRAGWLEKRRLLLGERMLYPDWQRNLAMLLAA